MLNKKNIKSVTCFLFLAILIIMIFAYNKSNISTIKRTNHEVVLGDVCTYVSSGGSLKPGTADDTSCCPDGYSSIPHYSNGCFSCAEGCRLCRHMNGDSFIEYLAIPLNMNSDTVSAVIDEGYPAYHIVCGDDMADVSHNEENCCVPQRLANNYCYKKLESNGYEYYVGETPPQPTGWELVGQAGTVTCSETPACYKNGNEYKWGNYNGVTGYTKVDGVSSAADCNKFCWKKSGSTGNEYQESVTSPGTGWSKVGAVGTVTCGETSACYQNGDEHKWGNYNGVTGYTKVDGVSSAADCNKFCWKKSGSTGNEYQESVTSPGTGWSKVGAVGTVTCSETPACYTHNGDYVWGKYNSVTGYTKVTDADESQCNKIVIKKVDDKGAEKTGASVSITSTNYNITSSIGHDTIAKLKPGTYVLKETIAPKDYKLDETEITIIVSNKGEITIADASNIYEKSTKATRNANLSIKNNLEEKCYYNPNTDDYKWASLPPSDDYKPVDSIDKEENCIKKEQDACYKNKETGKYVWGKYEKDSDYELVKNTSKDDCHEVIDNVPKTAMDRPIWVYISVIVLLLCGIGLFVYIYKFKKN